MSDFQAIADRVEIYHDTTPLAGSPPFAMAAGPPAGNTPAGGPEGNRR